MKKIAFVTLAALSVMFSCGNGGQNKPSASQGYQQVIGMTGERIENHLHDTVRLGTMKKGEVVEYRLGLRNDDTTALIILGVINGCGCTTLEYDRNPVQPGETLGMTLQYDSKGQWGTQMKAIQITTSLNEMYHTVMLLAEVE